MSILLLELAFIFLILSPLFIAVGLMISRNLRLKREVTDLRNTIVTVESQNGLKSYQIISVSNFIDHDTPHRVFFIDLQTLSTHDCYCYNKQNLLSHLRIL